MVFRTVLSLLFVAFLMMWIPAVQSQVVLNEVVYDATGDLSGDGEISESGDEFIEIYNAGTETVDISGWDVGDTNSGRFVFPESTTLEPGEYLTVFRDDNPTLSGKVFGGASFLLSNSGEVVELRDDTETVIDSTNDEGSTTNEAWEREPDGTGEFRRASHSTNNPETLFTPGQPNLNAFVPPEQLTVYFLDVGQGDSTLIVSPSGQVLLVDGGDNDEGDDVILPFLRTLGIDGVSKTLDYMVATHFDADHIGGLDEVAAVVLPTIAYDRGGPKYTDTFTFTSYQNAIASVRQQIVPGQVIDLGVGVTVQALCVGENLDTAGDTVENVIYPESRVPVDSDAENELAIGLRLNYYGFQMSVSGDMPGGGLGSNDVESSVATAIGNVDVYQVNHHASNTSSNEDYIRVLQPDVAVISTGGNPYGHPTQDVIDRLQSVGGSEVYQTETGSGGTGDYIAESTIRLRTNGWTYTIDGGALQEKTYNVDDATRTHSPQPGEIVINEIRVDDTGSLEFIELVGPAGLNLLGCTLFGLDASGSSLIEDKLVSLNGWSIPDDGFLVVGNSAVSNVDWVDPGAIVWQRVVGGVELRYGETVLDRVGYGSGGAGDYYEGSGPAPLNPDDGNSIGRDSSSTDTDDNAQDFRVLSPTPGEENPELIDYSGLLITEVCNQPNSDEFIELANVSTAAIPIGGVILTDEETSNTEGALRFSQGTMIATGEVIVVLPRATEAEPPTSVFQNALKAGTRLFALDTNLPGYTVEAIERYPSSEGGTSGDMILNNPGDNLAVLEPAATFFSSSGISDDALCIDGMNYGNVSVSVPAGPGIEDASVALTHTAGNSLQRTDSVDRNDSRQDFSSAPMTPGSLPFQITPGWGYLMFY